MITNISINEATLLMKHAVETTAKSESAVREAFKSVYKRLKSQSK